MKSIVLPASHYAAKWPASIQRKPAELTKLGAEYARTKNQEALLEILPCYLQLVNVGDVSSVIQRQLAVSITRLE